MDFCRSAQLRLPEHHGTTHGEAQSSGKSGVPAAAREITLAKLGLSGTHLCHDLWGDTADVTATSSVVCEIDTHGAALYKFTPIS